MLRTRAAVWALLLTTCFFLFSPDAKATGPVCDIGTGPAACIAAIQASGGVVNDIFKDAKNRTATNLPVYGTLVPLTKVYPACTTPPTKTANCAGCNPGVDVSPYDCPGQYSCTANGGASESVANPCTVASVGAAVNGKPDHAWGHPCRLVNHGTTCPDYSTCVADGTPGGYNPWEGFVFDLGGPSNQVAIFAMNDHGPQPCESVEYTVFLTNDPSARDVILAPTTTGADPGKWNRAVLKKVFTEGWYRTARANTPGSACGDTATYTVEEDSMVPIYALPCGISFRYAAIVAGNDGLDFPSCAFDSNEAELDSVAGLTETGDAVCPDADGDTYVDCKCVGAPAVCDCDDNDPNTHPTAPEACNATKDYNCNGITPEPCPPGRGCAAGVCVPFCGGELGCPPGSTCEVQPAGSLCVPNDCTTGGCPPGSTCDATSKKCVPNCDSGVVCPPGEKCISGSCVDPCRDIKCAAGFTCVDGKCNPPCACFAGDVGCAAGQLCDRPTDAGAASGQCVAPGCLGVSCPFPQHCNGGACIGFCDGVKCPPDQVCVPPASPGAASESFGCLNLCAAVTCTPPDQCDPQTGKCGLPATDGGGLLGPGDIGGDGGVGGNGADGSGGDTSGCACTTAGLARMSMSAFGAIFALGAMLFLRRRRS